MPCVLPPELWHLTLSQRRWTNDEIRVLRLVNKQLSALAEPLLFKSLLLRPNIDSLKRAQHVAETPRLAHHVEKIYFRGDVVTPHVQSAEDFRGLLRWWPLPGYDRQVLYEKAEEYVQNYPAGLEKQRQYRNINSFRSISAICKYLPNLLHLDFTTLEEDPLSKFSRTYGFETNTGTGISITEQLRLCQIVQPLSVVMPDLETTSFRQHLENGRFDQALFSGLAKVKNLTVRMIHLGEPPVFQEKHFELCSSFWAHTRTAEHVSIGFESDYQTFDRSYDRLVRILLQSNWPRAKKIELFNIRTSRTQLEEFLRRHKSTLHSLLLHKIIFTDVENDEANSPTYGCTFKFLVQLPRILTLQEFKIEGYIGDTVDEIWLVRRSIRPRTILSLVESFVCREGSFPFPEAAQILGLGPNIPDFNPNPLLAHRLDADANAAGLYCELVDMVYHDSTWRLVAPEDVLDRDPDNPDNFDTDSYISADQDGMGWHMHWGNEEDWESEEEEDWGSEEEDWESEEESEEEDEEQGLAEDADVQDMCKTVSPSGIS